jgi:hypothetical protein
VIKTATIETEYPYEQNAKDLNEYLVNEEDYEGIPCVVVKYRYHASGAENIVCLIKIKGHLVWVPFMKLRYQCCSECGI